MGHFSLLLHTITYEQPCADKLQEVVEVREAWHATVHGVAKSQIGLSD